MTANLVGFVVGPAGMHMLFSRMLSLQNIPLLFGIVFSMYIGTKIMFHIREWEAQQKENEKLKVPRSKFVDWEDWIRKVFCVGVLNWVQSIQVVFWLVYLWDVYCVIAIFIATMSQCNTWVV